MVLLPLGCQSVAQWSRRIPKPLPDHPGNIFVAGEDVSVPLAGGEAWAVTDYDGNTVVQSKTENGCAALGKLPPGYYELRVAGARRTTIGVLAPLAAPTPESSPISVDAAMSGAYPKAQQPKVASLLALAGVNWGRDRLGWSAMEPARGRFVGRNQQDDAVDFQLSAGLRVLQVHHASPLWANPDQGRFPPDLRDAFAFQREMARRWKGKVGAFEPWNEADIAAFGGHTGAEMASLQKASYLGLKAGNPDVIACMNVLPGPHEATMEDLNDNETWPYFDTFNFHCYWVFDALSGVYAKFRAASAGRPMWVTECNVPGPWWGDVPGEPRESDRTDRLHAQSVAKVYASHLYEGSAQVFYFYITMLLHEDLTPRPAFVGVAACGRLLAGARPLGRLPASSPWLTPVQRGNVQSAPAAQTVNALVFRAWPDGRERDVVVAWADRPQVRLDAARALAVFDLLGRARQGGAGIVLAPAPVFVVYPKDTFRGTSLQIPPPAPAPRHGKPSRVVLQALWPKDRIALGDSAYRISAEKREFIPIFIYNFGPSAVSGKLRVMAPAGWVAHLPARIQVQPGQHKELALSIDCHTGSAAGTETVKISGDFGADGAPVLSLRLMPQPSR